MNYPDYSRACEHGVRRLTNTKAVTFAQRAAIIDACLAARSFEELEPWIQDLLRPDFEAMEEYLRQPRPAPRSLPTVGRHELKPSGFANLLGSSLTRQPHTTQLGPDGRFSLCSQPPPTPPTGRTPPAPPNPPSPPTTKALDPSIETKAAPILRIEPYDPDAIDGDGDGIVQEGTAWERPAGTRLLDAAGRAIERGLTNAVRPQGLRVVDADGNDVAYKPRYGTGITEPTGPAPQKVTSKLGELGFPSLREQGMAPILDLMAPPAPKPEAPPKPEPKVSTPKPDIVPVAKVDVPWTVGIAGVDSPDVLADRERVAHDRLDPAGWSIAHMFENPGEQLLKYLHGPYTYMNHDLTPEQEANLAQLEAAILQLRGEYGEGDAIEEAFERLVLADIAEFIADTEHGELLINTSPTDAASVLEDGRYFSQFVTNKSSAGNPDFEHRREIEQRFGVPLDAPDEMRPVYGHVAMPGDDTPYAYRSAAYTYGQITFILKPGLTDRTTFSIGDSYNAMYGVSVADTDAETGSAVIASAVHQELLGWFYVRQFRDELTRIGADAETVELGTRIMAREFRLLEHTTDVYDPDRFPMGDFYYVEHQLHGGMSLDDLDAIHIPPNEEITPMTLEWRRDAIAADNTAKDRLRKLAKERGIRIIEDAEARPADTATRVSDEASAAVLEQLGGTLGGPLPYTPGVFPDDHELPFSMMGHTSIKGVADFRRRQIDDAIKTAVDALAGDDQGLGLALIGHMSRDEVIADIQTLLKDYQAAPTLLSTDAASVLGFFADESYLPASGLDGLETGRIEYELAGLGVPLDLPLARRPVYGHLDTRIEGDSVRALPGADYGQVHIVLKDELKDRTTMTIGDSLIGKAVAIDGAHLTDLNRVLAAIDGDLVQAVVDARLDRAAQRVRRHRERFWADEPGGMSPSVIAQVEHLDDYLRERRAHIRPNGEVVSQRLLDTTYLEAQVHGGVRLDDVAEIIVPAGDDPQLKALRAAAKDRGIRVVDEAAARRSRPIGEVATRVFTDFLGPRVGHHDPDPTTLTRDELATLAGQSLSSAQLDQYIGFHNGQLVVLEEHLAATVAENEARLRDLVEVMESGAALTFDEQADVATAAAFIVGQDTIRARARARVLQRERRAAEGRPLEVDYARLTEEYGLHELPSPDVWPPTPDTLTYVPDGSGAEVQSATRRRQLDTQVNAETLDLIVRALELDPSASVRLLDGTEVSQKDFLKLALLDIDFTDRSLAEIVASLPPDHAMMDMVSPEIVERVTELVEADIAHIRTGRVVINVPEDVVTDGMFGGGRYWSQFVTGTSNGELDPEDRMEAERVFAGIPMDLPDEDRPVYGHIIHDDADVARAECYGGWALVLRPSTTQDRTTFTIADSLAASALGGPDSDAFAAMPMVPRVDEDPLAFLPGPFARQVAGGRLISEHDVRHYVDRVLVERIDNLVLTLGVVPPALQGVTDQLRSRTYGAPVPRPGDVRARYIEAQIHGGVSLHDVDALYIDADDWAHMHARKRAEIMRIAEEYGIDITHTPTSRS